MIIKYTKTALGYTSEYRIDLVIKATKWTDESRTCIGYVHKGSWVLPAGETRWEFTKHSQLETKRSTDEHPRAPGIKDTWRHPLGGSYPDTLAEAKELVSEWIIGMVVKHGFPVADKVED